MRTNALFPALAALMLVCSAAAAADGNLSPAEKFIHKKLGERCHTHRLWPGEPPDEAGDIGPEKLQIPDEDGGIAKVTDVAAPSLTVCPPENSTGQTPAVIVCPGGGYRILAIEHEGTKIAEWLNSLGITAVILKYRVPPRKQGYDKHHHALQDAQRAMGLLRAHAEDWNIDPARSGILGFSAGGHLAATLSNNYQNRTYEPVDEADGESCKPQFAVPIYPAYLRRSDDSLQVADLQHPDDMSPASTPPTFMAVSQMDRFLPDSLAYLRALTQADVPAELHVFPKGKHGTGMRAYPFRRWTAECERWMRDRGIIGSE